jgi:hypothetical protein
VTATGASAYIFESRLNGKTVRVTIGNPKAWTLDAAQAKREAEEQRQREEEAARCVMTLADAWAAYLTDRRPHWGDLHYQDHVTKARPGGEAYNRRTKKPAKTKPGPLAALMPLPLHTLDAATIEKWAATEGKTRPASAWLAWRLLSVFLGWCREQPQYAVVVPAHNPAKTRRAREALGRPAVKSDVLTREQLKAWFAAVHGIRNKTTATARQGLGVRVEHEGREIGGLHGAADAEQGSRRSLRRRWHRRPDAVRPAPQLRQADRVAGNTGRRGGADSRPQAQRHGGKALQAAPAGPAAPAP